MSFKNIFVILPFFILLSSCLTVNKKVHSPENLIEKRICILYHPTKFRNIVVDKLKTRLLDLNYEIVIDNAKHAKEYSPEKFDKVVIFTGIHGFVPDAYPVAYIRKNKGSNKVIPVFCTFFSKKGVHYRQNLRGGRPDTVTAASLAENIDPLVDEIIEVIQN